MLKRYCTAPCRFYGYESNYKYCKSCDGSDKELLDVWMGKNVESERDIYKRMLNRVYGTHTEHDDYMDALTYIQADIEATHRLHKKLSEMEENNMPRTDRARTDHAVFYNYEERRWEKPYIKKVIFNDPATIVMWADGTKTVVKCQDGDKFDPEKGLTMAITKRFFGNKGNYCNELKKWLPEEETEIESVDFSIDLTPLGEAAERMGGNVSKAVSRITGRCEDCKYENVLGYKWPCVKCSGRSKWKPKKGE